MSSLFSFCAELRQAMLFKLLKVSAGCKSDSPKVVHFRGSDTDDPTIFGEYEQHRVQAFDMDGEDSCNRFQLACV